MAIRDKELRAEALGVPTFVLQIVSSTFASVAAAVTAGSYLMSVRYVKPESPLGVPVMLDVLLAVFFFPKGVLGRARGALRRRRVRVAPEV